MNIDRDLVSRNVFIHEPIHNSLTTFLGVVVTRVTKR